MTFALKTNSAAPGVVALLVLAGALALSGCGTPGAPQPPSLDLPEKVTDLTAVRAGQIVTLHWTTPRKNTDHLLIQKQIQATICRREDSMTCQPVGKIQLDPGSEGSYRDNLTETLVSGQPHPSTYFVELGNKSGHSAGPSNPATILLGAAPPPIESLTAEVRANGVALHWQAGQSTAVRLHRRLISATTEKKSKASLTSAPAESPSLDLFVDPASTVPIQEGLAGALDATVHFGQTYEYTAQRVQRLTVDAGQLELASELSSPVRIDVIDTFPPAVPQELAAVLVTEDKTIDLSWQPVSDDDLAGYIVYRTAGTEGEPSWQRISGPKPVTGPAFRDVTVEVGHSYRYAVSAIDQTGHESERSSPAQESVPNP